MQEYTFANMNYLMGYYVALSRNFKVYNKSHHKSKKIKKKNQWNVDKKYRVQRSVIIIKALYLNLFNIFALYT